MKRKEKEEIFNKSKNRQSQVSKEVEDSFSMVQRRMSVVEMMKKRNLRQNKDGVMGGAKKEEDQPQEKKEDEAKEEKKKKKKKKKKRREKKKNRTVNLGGGGYAEFEPGENNLSLGYAEPSLGSDKSPSESCGYAEFEPGRETEEEVDSEREDGLGNLEDEGLGYAAVDLTKGKKDKGTKKVDPSGYAQMEFGQQGSEAESEEESEDDSAEDSEEESDDEESDEESQDGSEFQSTNTYGCFLGSAHEEKEKSKGKKKGEGKEEPKLVVQDGYLVPSNAFVYGNDSDGEGIQLEGDSDGDEGESKQKPNEQPESEDEDSGPTEKSDQRMPRTSSTPNPPISRESSSDSSPSPLNIRTNSISPTLSSQEKFLPNSSSSGASFGRFLGSRFFSFSFSFSFFCPIFVLSLTFSVDLRKKLDKKDLFRSLVLHKTALNLSSHKETKSLLHPLH